MKYQSERRQLIDGALEMNRVGLNQGTAGNISLRVGAGFLITPTGVPYTECEPEHIVLMGLDGQPIKTDDAQLAPSSEWRFHRDLYQHRDETGAILHAHSTWCTVLACLNKDIPAFHYMVAVAGGDSIRCTPYATFGTQALSDYALEALKGRLACLLGHHGLLCQHTNLNKVMALAIEVEHLAQVYCQTLQIGLSDKASSNKGSPKLINPMEMRKVIEKFKTYGKQPTK